MSISDKDNRYLSDIIYTIDKKHPKYNSDIKSNAKIDVGGSEYQVLQVKDNTENGMQAMAVAPAKNGVVDTSQVVIAYAGTNAGDDLDTLTDIQTVGLSKDKLTYTERYFMPGNAVRAGDNTLTKNISADSQAVTALDFAKEIKNKYKDSNITTTGHSLGEYLALLVAAENKWVNVGFNGPDPYNNLSKSAKEWVKKNPGYLNNYRNSGDLIGNAMFNGTGAELKISMDLGLNPFKGVFHALSTWKFDAKGKLIIPKNDYNKEAIQQQAERYIVASFTSKLNMLEILKKTLAKSGGNLSFSERIYLEDSMALAVVESTAAEFQTVMSRVIVFYQKAITKAEKMWAESLSDARLIGTKLTEWEILVALENGGCTQNNIVNEPKVIYQGKIDKANKMVDEFDDLTKSIKSKIAEIIQRDHELAQQLKGLVS